MALKCLLEATDPCPPLVKWFAGPWCGHSSFREYRIVYSYPQTIKKRNRSAAGTKHVSDTVGSACSKSSIGWVR